MRVRLLQAVMCENPAYKPPDPRTDPNGWMTYKHRVPYQIEKPAGEEIEHPYAWIHCLPNSAGVVIAEPVDDEARLVVDGEAKTLDPLTRKRYEAHIRRLEASRPKPIAEEPNGNSEQTGVSDGMHPAVHDG